MVDPATKGVELKLAATGEAMDTLLASPLLRGHARSTVRSRNLVTTYYDTEDHRLGRRRLALRVRQSGKKFIQTLKTASAGEGAETSGANGRSNSRRTRRRSSPRSTTRPCSI